jgi:hypothetical protein
MSGPKPIPVRMHRFDRMLEFASGEGCQKGRC